MVDCSPSCSFLKNARFGDVINQGEQAVTNANGSPKSSFNPNFDLDLVQLHLRLRQLGLHVQGLRQGRPATGDGSSEPIFPFFFALSSPQQAAQEAQKRRLISAIETPLFGDAT